ncbi:leucine-rich repeat domain-containing protein [Dysgonomonas sp. 25]|uniref:leucine-rich repeat domain-containing protein n=1 Tax=Dysgonomonas sp. 25 TaxID=2302933 RepID=UPI0013D23018|nr:hypothetical protein [Dysgonomonas sp. 25]NDV70323.1 hypothetical protein [Dysgonomonas sp. 25]
MKQKILTQAIIILALFTATINLHGQVTIGSAEPPVDGALLDLKMKPDGTSTLGLGLPKVQLSKLRPATDAELAQSIGNTSESYNMADHVGLIVYNILDAPLCGRPTGPYLWDGEQWVQLIGIPPGELKGSYAEDVQALKDLYNANPGNTLHWNLSGDPTGFAGVTWEIVCGEKRVTGLSIGTKNLTFATGIDKLYALRELECTSNQLTSLNVSANTVLTKLNCDHNQLATLSVPDNAVLATLTCSYNQLSALDVSANTALTYLECHQNQLTNLDVSKNTALTTLRCDYNSLTILDVSKNTALMSLNCNGNQLSNLNISVNTALTELYCGNNQLTALNVSANTALTALSFHNNQLTTLDISNNTALTSLHCQGNKLSSLNISANTALTTLYCPNNELTVLDVSVNTALTALNCRYNRMIQAEVNKFKLHPNYCPNISNWVVTPQNGTTVTKPTCP